LKQVIKFMVNLLYKVISFIFYCCISLSVSADLPTTIKSESMSLSLEQVVDGLGIPWGMSFLSEHHLLVTERSGAVRLVEIGIDSDNDRGRISLLNNVPDVLAEGQGGMLDIAVSPNYKKDGWIYFTYVKEVKGQGATVLSRAKLVARTFSNWQELLVTKSTTEESRHFGSRITFDEHGHVFFSVGDRGIRKNSQDLSNHAGSIMRLNLDGSVPEDNPFSKNKQLLPEVWSYGHRNPQGMAYDAENERLWSIEHGPRGGDEINLIHSGANYGWPVISYGKEYWGPIAVGEGTHRKGMEQPVKVYVPSIAPGSLLFYSGNALPDWKGNLLSGALKLQHINRIVLSQQGEVLKEERLLEDLGERIRALAQSPQGWLYFSTDSGKIFRLRPVE
jgi:glucose/arabinose dehydrogenase